MPCVDSPVSPDINVAEPWQPLQTSLSSAWGSYAQRRHGAPMAPKAWGSYSQDDLKKLIKKGWGRLRPSEPRCHPPACMGCSHPGHASAARERNQKEGRGPCQGTIDFVNQNSFPMRYETCESIVIHALPQFYTHTHLLALIHTRPKTVFRS